MVIRNGLGKNVLEIATVIRIVVGIVLGKAGNVSLKQILVFLEHFVMRMSSVSQIVAIKL